MRTRHSRTEARAAACIAAEVPAVCTPRIFRK
jgi:hypothetical protein